MARRKKKQSGGKRSWLRRGAAAAALLIIILAATLLLERAYAFADPFPVAALDHAPASLIVTAGDGAWLRVTATPEGDRRMPVGLDRVSKHVEHALIASEDRRFYDHSGVDGRAVLRACFGNLFRGHVVSGASTLSMQLARMVEPRSRTMLAKAHEMVRARQVERIKNKREVLEAYLNLAPFSGNVRGVEAAGMLWFGKHAIDLSASEAAALVAMLPSPAKRSPGKPNEPLLAARNRVLERMQTCGFLSAQDSAAAQAEPLHAERHAWPHAAQDAVDLALAGAPGTTIGNDYGPPPESAYGARIVSTAVDPQLQQEIEALAENKDSFPGDAVALAVFDRSSGLLRACAGTKAAGGAVNAAAAPHSVGGALAPVLMVLAGDPEPAPPDEWLRLVGDDVYRDVLRDLGVAAPESASGATLANGDFAASPAALGVAYSRLFGPKSPVAARKGSAEAVLRRLTRPLFAGVSHGALRPAHAWIVAPSPSLRDSWCVGVTERHVLIAWLGKLDGRGAAGTFGGRTSVSWLGELAALARSSPRFPG